MVQERRPDLAPVRLEIPVVVTSEVYGDHLGGAAALELERPEAVGGPDIEAALSANIGPRQAPRRSAADRTTRVVTNPGAISIE